MIALVNFDSIFFSELVDKHDTIIAKHATSVAKHETSIKELRESHTELRESNIMRDTTIAELRELYTNVSNDLKRRNARSTLRDLLAKYKEVEMRPSLTSFSHSARQIYGVPMQSQLQRAKSHYAKLWQASQHAAITASKSAPFATEFTTLFTKRNVNQLN